MADDYINKDDSLIGSKDDVATKIHFMSRFQQKYAMVSDSRRNKVRTTAITSNSHNFFHLKQIKIIISNFLNVDNEIRW